MTTDILLKRAMQKIAAASATFNTAEIARLNKLAEQIAHIGSMQAALSQDLAVIASELESDQNTEGKSAPTTKESLAAAVIFGGPLTISIDWRAIGVPSEKQVICERYGSDTLRVFFESIYMHCGEETLRQLAQIPVNRGRLLSRQPKVDFLNTKKGVCYQHQSISDSGWYVLTNSSAPEKITIVRQVARALKFPPGSLLIQEVDQKERLEELMRL